MAADVSGAAVALGVGLTLLGGCLTIAGVRLGIRWSARVDHDQARVIERRRHDERRHVELQQRLDDIDGNVADVRERLAGVEAILRWKAPELADRPPLPPRGRADT